MKSRHLPLIGLAAFFILIHSAGKWAAGEVRVVKDQPYKTGDQLSDYEKQRCKLDLYLPEKTDGGFPVVVWFHGGGLTGGNKNGAAAFGKRLAMEGIGMVAANYRLSPKVTYPAYNQDAAAAVAWTKKHIAEYGGNADELFVAGHSAGGYLTAIVGYDPDLLAEQGMKLTDLAGIIAVAPQVFTHFEIRKERGIPNPETTPVIDKAAPCYYTNKDARPTLILLGDHDWPVRLEECTYFVAMLKYSGDKDVALHVIPDRNHGTLYSKMVNLDDPGLKYFLDFIHEHEKKGSK